MSSITLSVFDISTKRQIETVQYVYGYGNFTKLKMELAMRRKIIYFNEIILTNSDGKAIQSEDELKDQQQIWFDCLNPLYDKKEHQLSIQEHIISIKTQLHSQKLLYRKSIQLPKDKKFQLSNKIIDQQFDMSTTFDNIEESKSVLLNSSQSERNYQIEEKLKKKQLDALKFYKQYNIKQNQNNKEAIKEYFELKEKHQEEIRKIEEKKLQVYDQMKQAKPHELQEFFDKLKQLEDEKQKKVSEKQLIEDQFRHERETRYRKKIFDNVKDIKKEMTEMKKYFKTADNDIIDKINQFFARIIEIEQISKEKTQQAQQ